MSKTPIYKWFDEIKYIRNKRLKYYNYENCGTIETSENFQMVNFISNGEKVRSINDLPWAVQIISFGKFRCTGTMISRKHVLTAGHCLFSSKTGISYDNVTDHDVPNTEIVVSTSCKQDKKLQQNCKNQPGEKYKVRNFYRNPFYTSHKTSNDIMVLELQTEIPRMVHACLAFLHNDTFPKYDEGIVFGWGSAEYKKKWGSSHVLRKVKIFGTVSVVPTCMKDKSLATTNNLIGLTQLSGNKRPCSGDSGAGVIQTNQENQHFVTGIVSHGIKCKEAVGQIADSYVYHRGLTDGYTCVSCFSGEIYDFMAQAED
uniref:Peptidase S1 domain-containing protein n=1 Tax=Rhabditophanes sp. KR3021 TaxID=114890 RepID=A0AC35UB77_9BILA